MICKKIKFSLYHSQNLSKIQFQISNFNQPTKPALKTTFTKFHLIKSKLLSQARKTVKKNSFDRIGI